MKAYAKCLVALLGGLATWGTTAAEGGIQLQEWFGVLAVAATAVGVWATPNDPPS